VIYSTPIFAKHLRRRQRIARVLRVIGVLLLLSLAFIGVRAMPRLYDGQPYIWLPSAGRIPIDAGRRCDPQKARLITVRVFEINGKFVSTCVETIRAEDVLQRP